MLTGLALGTTLAALAMADGVRFKVGGPPFVGWLVGGLIVWALVVAAATAVAEVLRRHHRAIGRWTGRQAWRAARYSGRTTLRLGRRHGGRGLDAAARWAGGRWQGRGGGPEGPSREPVELGAVLRPSRWRRRPADGDGAFTDPDPTSPDGFPPIEDPVPGPARGDAGRPVHLPDEAARAGWGAPDPDASYGAGPWMLAVRRRDGRPYYDVPFSPDVASATVHDEAGLRRRLTAAAADPGLAVRVVPLKLTDPDLAGSLDPAAEADVKRQVCDMGAADGLDPDEVLVSPDGSVTIDRRRNPDGRYPWAVPLVGEYRWSPFNGTARAYAVHPSQTPTPDPDPIPDGVEDAVRARVCALPWAAAEGVGPGDVTLGPYGGIAVDRSRAHPGMAAYDGLRWVPLPGGSVAVVPTWPAAAGQESTTDHQHGGTMTTASNEAQPPYFWPGQAGGGSPRRPARLAAAPDVNGTWRPLIGSTHDFEPESDSHLLGWMAGEAGGMTGYAEAVQDAYETAVNTVGLDPVAMQALHDYADAAAEAAEAMAAARQRFADHYSEVRAFAANGGVLPFNGRWMTGEGD